MKVSGDQNVGVSMLKPHTEFPTYIMLYINIHIENQQSPNLEKGEKLLGYLFCYLHRWLIGCTSSFIEL